MTLLLLQPREYNVLTMTEKKILGAITARGGSKGIPKKNIRPLGGKPLLAYTIESAKQSQLITHLIVSTEDEEIAAVARGYGALVPFMRPVELAGDDVHHLPVLQHAVKTMEEQLGVVFDYVVKLQPTSPFRTVEDIDGTIRLLAETDADSAVTVVEVDENHPLKMKKIENGRLMPYCFPEPEGIPRQFLPKVYKRNAAVYVLKRDNLLLKNREYGDDVAAYLMPAERSIDIDNEFDWLKAEHMLEKLRAAGYSF